MKEKEFNLSEKRIEPTIMMLKEEQELLKSINKDPTLIWTEDVKEFIKIIQDECSLSIEQRRILQNRAGKDLI